MYDYRITIGDSYTLENAPQKDLPYISGAVVNNATSSANRLTIGGTVSDKLVFDIINPPTMELDGLSVKLEIKEVRELSNDDGGDVTLNISDLNEFLDDVQDLPDSPTDDTGADITVDTESMSGEVYEFDTPVGETGDADNDEILENDVYRDDGEDVQGEASADVEPVTEWIEFGTYYITNVVQTSENAVNITALDGFILMGDTFTPAVYNTTATALFEDFAAKVEALGVSVDDATMPEINIHWQGAYTLREAAGLFASLVGGYASFNRGGHLELRQYRKNTPIIQFADVMAYGSTSAAITINGVACDNSASLVATNWITTGDDDTVELKFKNPYVTAAILPDILAVYLYTVYKPCTVTAPYSYQYEAGDFIQVYTSQDVAEWICITNQTINLDSGLVAIESLGNSETLEANAQESPVDAKFKNLYSEMIEAKYIKADRVVADGLEANKAEIADLVADNLEVGSINGNVIQNGSVLAAALSQEAIQTIGGNKVYYQAEAPTGGTYIEGDTWYKTVIADSDADKKVLHVWNGTEWEPTDFDARILRANTITAQEIAANTIEAGNINLDNLQTNLARIGSEEETHLVIDNDSMEIVNSNNEVYFSAESAVVGNTKEFKVPNGETFSVVENPLNPIQNIMFRYSFGIIKDLIEARPVPKVGENSTGHWYRHVGGEWVQFVREGVNDWTFNDGVFNPNVDFENIPEITNDYYYVSGTADTNKTQLTLIADDNIAMNEAGILLKKKNGTRVAYIDWAGRAMFNMLTVGGNLIADFVIEEGTAGNWQYRKWANGRCEAWRTYTLSTSVNTAWGGIYRSAGRTLGVPTVFNAAPQIFATSKGTACWVICCSDAQPGTDFTFYIANGVSLSAANRTFSFYMNGTWK